jgi:hypothetical protein
MSKKNITFINDDFYYNPNSSVQSFYQVCLYKNEHKNMYGVRKIKFNERMEIINAVVKYYPKKILDKFIDRHKLIKENKVRLYPYNDINMVPYPTMSDMNESFSNLLNGGSNEISGFSSPMF